MYLTKKTYVKNWDHRPKEEHHLVRVERGGIPRTDIRPERITYIIEDVAYWRKANAVHRWFVEHVQQGNDDCGTYAVTRDQLSELRDLCNQVLAASTLTDGLVKNGERLENHRWVPMLELGKTIKDAHAAKEMLPSESGFFFGSTDYDEYYYQDLADTCRMLDTVLAETGDDFEYHASW